MLVGRREERGRVARLLAAARARLSGALVICGEGGIGTTALLEIVAWPASLSAWSFPRIRDEHLTKPGEENRGQSCGHGGRRSRR